MTATTPEETPDNVTLNDLIADDIQEIREIGLNGVFHKYEDLILQFGIDWGLRLIAAILILVVGWSVGSWFAGRMNRAKRLDHTLKIFLGALFKYAIMCVAIVTVIGLFGIPMASLLAVMGAAGLAIGLALQGTLSNIASGVMLLILRPFNVGDYITWGDQGGTVKSLGLFGTVLSMPDNVYVFAPNSKIWGNEIRNFSRNPHRRQDIVVAIDYNDDIDKALAVLTQIATTEDRILQDHDKSPQVVTDRLNDYTIDVIVRFWSLNADYWALRWDMTKKIKAELEKAGINLALVPRQMAIENPDAISRTEQR